MRSHLDTLTGTENERRTDYFIGRVAVAAEEKAHTHTHTHTSEQQQSRRGAMVYQNALPSSYRLPHAHQHTHTHMHHLLLRASTTLHLAAACMLNSVPVLARLTVSLFMLFMLFTCWASSALHRPSTKLIPSLASPLVNACACVHSRHAMSHATPHRGDGHEKREEGGGQRPPPMKLPRTRSITYPRHSAESQKQTHTQKKKEGTPPPAYLCLSLSLSLALLDAHINTERERERHSAIRPS